MPDSNETFREYFAGLYVNKVDIILIYVNAWKKT